MQLFIKFSFIDRDRDDRNANKIHPGLSTLMKNNNK